MVALFPGNCSPDHNDKKAAVMTDRRLYPTAWTGTRTVVIGAAFVWLCCPGLLLGDQLSPRFQKLRENYQHLPPIHFAVDIGMFFLPNEGSQERRIVTHYEYWGEGQKYRIDTSLSRDNDPEGGKGKQITYAYDGDRFQRFDITRSELNYSKKETATLPEIVPDPMLYPVLFMSPGVERPGERLRFKDLQDDAAWERILKSVRAGQSTNGWLVAKIPAGRLGDKECHFRIYFGQDPNFMPRKIERVSEDGNVSARFTIEEYVVVNANGKNTYWPKAVRFETIVDGNVQINCETTLRMLDIGTPLPPGVFTIDHTLADTVWDDDVQIAVKTKKSFRVSPGILDLTVDERDATGGNEVYVGVEEGERQPTERESPDTSGGGEPREETEAVLREPGAGNAVWLTIAYVVLAASVVYGLVQLWRKRARRKTPFSS